MRGKARRKAVGKSKSLSHKWAKDDYHGLPPSRGKTDAEGVR